MPGATSSHPEILATDSPARFAAAVDRASERLRAGDVVAVPTETVYGLAANAFNPSAVQTLFRLKGRPHHNPVIVHVVGIEMARECVADWPPAAGRLAVSFWPGPLTMVLPRTSSIPREVTGGGDTVAVRWPAHPFMQALIKACGFPLAAPSANRANQVSPTQARHVLASLGDRVGLIVDGGHSQIGIESTVVDLTLRPPRVLRPGMINEQALSAVLGPLGFSIPASEKSGSGHDRPLRSPGLLPRHYAPRARVVVLAWKDQDELASMLARMGIDVRTTHVLAYQQIPDADFSANICVIPNDPEAYARALYAEWHRCDDLGAKTIVVEAVPDGDAWRGIADRLARAETSP